MILHDTAHDREAEPGSLFPGRDVGLEQSAAVLFRQTDSVVDHVDDYIAAFATRENADAAAAELVRWNGGDRFGRIFDGVGQRLRDEPAGGIGGGGGLGGFDPAIHIALCRRFSEKEPAA